MAEKVTSKEGKRKVAVVMGEFGAGKLKSSDGKKVTDRKQALAIAMSEGRKQDKPKGALFGAVVTKRRASPQTVTPLPIPPAQLVIPDLPATASTTAKSRAFGQQGRRKRKDKTEPPVPAKEGAVVSPLSANLPRDLSVVEAAPPAESPARGLIREGLAELVKEGLWPDYRS